MDLAVNLGSLWFYELKQITLHSAGLFDINVIAEQTLEPVCEALNPGSAIFVSVIWGKLLTCLSLLSHLYIWDNNSTSL